MIDKKGRITVISPSDGVQKMIVDCGDYEVRFNRSQEQTTRDSFIEFWDIKSNKYALMPGTYHIEWTDDFSRIEIEGKDRWGSGVRFVNYFPSDLTGMLRCMGLMHKIFKILGIEV